MFPFSEIERAQGAQKTQNHQNIEEEKQQNGEKWKDCL